MSRVRKQRNFIIRSARSLIKKALSINKAITTLPESFDLKNLNITNQNSNKERHSARCTTLEASRYGMFNQHTAKKV